MGRFGLLADELKVKVRPQVEEFGRALFEEGGAEVTSAHEGELRAGIDDGKRRYKVKVTWGPAGYNLSCSCGAAEGHVCPHVWAAILEAREEGWLDEDEWDDDYDDYGGWRSPYPRRYEQPKSAQSPRWKAVLEQLAASSGAEVTSKEVWPASRQVAYVIDVEETMRGKGLVVEVCAREPKKDGELSKPKPAKIGRRELAALPLEEDRLILATLSGGEPNDYGYYDHREASKYRLGAILARVAVPRMCATGRCLLRPRGWGAQEYLPLTWGDDRPWEMHVEVTRDAPGKSFVVQGVLERGAERRPLGEPTMLTAGGLVFWKGVVEPLEDFGAFSWVAYLRENASIGVPQTDADELARRLYEAGRVPGLRLPDELKLEEVRTPLSLHLKLKAPARSYSYDNRLVAKLTFAYDTVTVDGSSYGSSIVDAKNKRVVVRDQQKEAEAHVRLYQLGFREGWDFETRKNSLQLAPSKLPKVVATLVAEGWHVEADGKLYRQPGELRVEVNSGIDWFDLHGSVQFGDQTATLPQLLAALRKGEGVVQLGDGTFGMLPQEWLKKYGVLAGMGKEEGEALRFGRAQAGLLDALLAAQENGAAKWDQTFEATRKMLREFEGVRPVQPCESFRGALRPYQSEGLGWLEFLRQFGFGGCLADDMGLGKTVQVLAMLAERGRRRVEGNGKHAHAPTLIVVPRSLVFNWKSEAARFAPHLRVLDHSVAGRVKGIEHLTDYDVVLTTYGTLRRDAAYLKDFEFDYVILDEAQAIKNAASDSAKAARLLRGRHRLALSGTPVQNHLGELWSLFEFLNPGMLGSASVFSSLAGSSRSLDDDGKQVLARAVRPFVLRRTKEQVARDLPAKLEQTIYCEMDADQRKLYDELRDYYRRSLLDIVARDGMNKAKIHVLEGLLRLRQAACHPGLLDKQRQADPSAKLDMLLPRLSEIVEEGHKALVFSQFTSFLAIVKKRLTKEKVKFEYLDGKTKDRQERVERFQSDEKCKVFLISLKAGGVGLNLTAADYVFLLDPWWNPAAEAQAIDRTHRIGQTRQVFACRLIAKDTVEEKVLELQKGKRDLADAIINADNSVIGSLRREDLELLLS
jgi:superfamily II DNA or RNA helicase